MGKGKNNAYLPNVQWMLEAGIDPKTKLPIKLGLSDPVALKENIKRQLRIIDEQDHVNKGKWFNIPLDVTSQYLQRMLYYKGQLILFYCKDLERFFILPFTNAAPEGNGLDELGRYQYVRPVAYNAGAVDDEKEKNRNKTPLEEYLSRLTLKVRYAPLTEITEEDLYNSAVIIQDYTPQYNSMNVMPRSILVEGLLDTMAECIPFMRTSLILGTGVTGMRVQDADQSQEVTDASLSMLRSALCGLPWIPIEAQVELQELTGKNMGKAEEYMLAMQSLDNFRLSTLGIDNGGLFEKKAHELQSEADLNGGPVGLVMQDDITIKQDACNIINSIWGIGMWYEPSETVSKADANGDGVYYDRNEAGENSGVETGGNNDDTDEV